MKGLRVHESAPHHRWFSFSFCYPLISSDLGRKNSRLSGSIGSDRTTHTSAKIQSPVFFLFIFGSLDFIMQISIIVEWLWSPPHPEMSTCHPMTVAWYCGVSRVGRSMVSWYLPKYWWGISCSPEEHSNGENLWIYIAIYISPRMESSELSISGREEFWNGPW